MLKPRLRSSRGAQLPWGKCLLFSFCAEHVEPTGGPLVGPNAVALRAAVEAQRGPEYSGMAILGGGKLEIDFER